MQVVSDFQFLFKMTMFVHTNLIVACPHHPLSGYRISLTLGIRAVYKTAEEEYAVGYLLPPDV